jgi:hypothetical protein
MRSKESYQGVDDVFLDVFVEVLEGSRRIWDSVASLVFKLVECEAS